MADRKILTDLLDKAFEMYGEQTCVVQGKERWTFADIKDLSLSVGNAMAAAGLKPGMKAAIFSLNDVWAFVATLAIIRAGAIWVPINPRSSLEDNLAILKQFGCDGLVFGEGFEEAADQIGKQHSDICFVTALSDDPKGRTTIQRWAHDFPPTAPEVSACETDIVAIPMTGGSTGLPKAVALSNRNFVAILEGTNRERDDPHPIMLAAAPMTHVTGRAAIANLYCGGTCVILPTVDIEQVLDAIENHRVTSFFLPPTAIYTLLDHPGLEKRDLSSLKSLGYGSAPMSIEKLKQAIHVLGPIMRGGYGQTEAPMLISRLAPEDHLVDGELAPDERLRSVGKATSSSTIAILDENGNQLPPNERGEIAVKGDFVSEGYFENPKATAEVRVNGWHLTGDIGYLDEEGYLYVVDRKKDMIITGGFNVYSAEVERIVSSVPGVKDCVVIGVPDDKWGEAVKAIVIPESKNAVEPEKIISICKEKLGSVKTPKSVDFATEFPRSANGKVLKKDIRADYWRGVDRQI